MTDDAFETLEVILNKHVSILQNLLVALVAGHVRMFSIQFESRFIVIKTGNFPAVVAVAFRAIGHAFYLKLSVVAVVVATRTGGGQAVKFAVSEIRLRFVAIAAGGFLMRTDQFELGF